MKTVNVRACSINQSNSPSTVIAIKGRDATITIEDRDVDYFLEWDKAAHSFTSHFLNDRRDLAIVMDGSTTLITLYGCCPVGMATYTSLISNRTDVQLSFDYFTVQENGNEEVSLDE